MSAMPHRKINREDVYREIVKMIEQSDKKEAEVSITDLANKFGIKGPTMDYHLSMLVEEGKLEILPKRGKYKRKIYKIPGESKNNNKLEQEDQATQIITPSESTESYDNYQDFLASLKGKVENPISIDETEDLVEKEAYEEEFPHEDRGISEDKQIEHVEQYQPEEKMPLGMESKELTLDEKIEQFIKTSNQLPDAHMLLRHEDKEILAVMNETIRQNIIYLQDLSQQLSTIQNKELIQHLIDDRKRLEEQIKRLEDEVEVARNQAKQVEEQFEIDPQRIRFMHQLAISTLDDYLKQPNQSLALGRKEFRNKISKEISDIVNYALKIQK
ncbi:helix-turn-helix domain-containing protein [Bacillus atrophaeus]|uniref:helix-turn-helix domain-containing protein n=1 Tax=Bacillus atrophaeus TaxID=1452 RepID=UPI002281A6A0|nr:helix-turn-helix domain-containing protein [Bacillus atrophaeus]MCY8466438.1 helix-turn-helix domain-containing protein [Bacillus atrophaeus]MCY8478897.1 helix-turn-helix domain-containing protein [Bacillus atrophaeus]